MPAKVFIRDSTPPMRGIFSIRVLDASGNVLSSHTEHNMIVNSARVAMSILVSEGRADKVITRFGVGDSQTPATPTDTELTNGYINNLIKHEFPDNGLVKFFWRLDYGEANGKHISEFSLLCTDGTMFSRKVREPIYKGPDIAFEGEWSIIF